MILTREVRPDNSERPLLDRIVNRININFLASLSQRLVLFKTRLFILKRRKCNNKTSSRVRLRTRWAETREMMTLENQKLNTKNISLLRELSKRIRKSFISAPLINLNVSAFQRTSSSIPVNKAMNRLTIKMGSFDINLNYSLLSLCID